MWLLTKDLVTKKWRTRNKTNLKEFERISNKAVDIEHINKHKMMSLEYHFSNLQVMWVM